jgi:hypothetical protein
MKAVAGKKSGSKPLHSKRVRLGLRVCLPSWWRSLLRQYKEKAPV